VSPLSQPSCHLSSHFLMSINVSLSLSLSPPPPQTLPPPYGMLAAVCLKEALCARRKAHSCAAGPCGARVCVNIYARPRTHTNTHTHKHAHTHTRTHTHTHITDICGCCSASLHCCAFLRLQSRRFAALSEHQHASERLVMQCTHALMLCVTDGVQAVSSILTL